MNIEPTTSGGKESPKRGPGRPPKDPAKLAKSYKCRLTLDGPIPFWISYEDLKCLIRQYRGRMYEEREFKVKVEHGVFPSYIEEGLKTAVPSVRRRKYRWPEAMAWIDAQMTKAQPKGILVNGEFQAARMPQ